MVRRTALAAAAALSAALTGCVSTPAPVSSQTVSQLAALARGLASVATAEAQTVGAPATIVARIAADAQSAQTAISALQGISTLAGALSSARSVEVAVRDVLALAGALPLPPAEQQVVVALEVLLPIVETSLGLASAASAGPQRMTAAEAQAILEQAPR